MNVFSDRDFFSLSPDKYLQNMINKDLDIINERDPFISNLLKAVFLKNKEDIINIKRNYWPSLLKAIDHKDAYIRAMTVFLMTEESIPEVEKKLWHNWEDTFPLCRLIMVKKFNSEHRNKIYNELFRIVTRDPVHFIRKSAADRLHREFPDLISFNMENFSKEEKIHLLDLVQFETAGDRNLLEPHISENDEFTMLSLFRMKHENIFDIPLKTENNIKFLSRIAGSGYFQIENIQIDNGIDFDEWLDDLISIIISSRKDHQIEYFIEMLNYIKDKNRLKYLNKVVSYLKDNLFGFNIDNIEYFIQHIDWNDDSLDELTKLINSQNSIILENLIIDFIDDDDFPITEKWNNKISKSMNDTFFNKLFFKLLTENIESAAFKKSFLIISNTNKSNLKECLKICCKRTYSENDKAIVLYEILDGFNKSDLKKIEKDIIEFIEENPVYLREIVLFLPENIELKPTDTIIETLNNMDDPERAETIENLYRIDKENNFNLLIQFMDDYSNNVREKIANILDNCELNEKESELLKEVKAVHSS